MPKFGGFLGFNTGLKVCAGVAVGYAGTVAVQHWRTSEPLDNVPPPMREERDERQKKFEFEVQQRSEQLNKKEQTLKALEETLAKREAALKEERSALQYMQAKNNAPSESETVAVQGVREEVSKVVESTTVKVAHPDPVVSPTDDGPRRPQVFDGGGNREPVMPKVSATDEPRLLYFNDPSFATGMKPTVSADGRGILRYSPLPPTEPNLRRYTNLKPQHVVSFRATKDGWSLETQDGAVGGGSETSAHETRSGLTIPPTTAGAPRKSEKGDATVVTLHGHGPKPPSDGRSAVSEAERNAFNEEKRILAEQRKAFDREKSKKEKELADKKQALDDREAELELRDNAADLFDLEEREMQRAERQKAKYKANTKVQRTENFNILREKKEPYEIEKQNEESMTIKRQPKPDLVYENCDAVEISAKEKEPYQNQIITSIDLRGKERVENKIESTNSINLLSLEKPGNEIDFGKELTVLRAYDPEDEKLKELLLMQHLDELTVRSEPKKASNTQAIALSGAQPPYVKKRIGAPKTQKQGSREKKTLKPEQTNEVMLLASEKPANQREYGERVKILPKPKPEFKKTTLEGFTVGAVERKPYETECTDAIELAYEEPKKTKNTITSGKGFEIQAKPSAKADKPNLTSQHSYFSLPAEKKVGPTITDTFKTPSKKKDNDADQSKVKTRKSQTKRKKRYLLSSSYDVDGLLDDYIEEDEESEKEEKEVPAFALDEKPVAENKISKTESIQILQKKEKPLLISTKSEDFEVKAMQKPSRNLEISKTQPITAEAQAVETKESATDPQKPELSIASNTAVSFGKNTLPKKEFTIDGRSELLVAPKKTEKTEANVGTEPPQLKIAKTETVTAEAKKVEKRDSGTEMEAPTPSVIAREVSFGYQTKNQPKPLLVQNNDGISLTGAKSFGKLQKDAVTESMHIPAKPKPTLEIGEQRENLLIEAQPKPESEISSVETFGILRRAKPENQISPEVSVEVLPKPKQTYVKTNGDPLFIKGNDANWHLQFDLEETKAELEAEEEASELLKTELDLTKTLPQTEKARTFDALKSTKAVSESVKDSRDTEVQIAGEVPLFKESTSLSIEKEKSSKDLIIDLDEDDFEEVFKNKRREVPRELQHKVVADIVRIWVRSYISDKDNTESVVSKIFEGKDKETKEVKEKLKKIEEKLLLGNDGPLTQKVREIITQYISSLNDTPIDAVEILKVAKVNKKSGWSVLEIRSNTADDTLEGNVQSKFSRELYPSGKNRICFIGKSAVTMDGTVQADESKVFGRFESERTNAIVGNDSGTETLRKETAELREKLRKFDGMDPKVVKNFRGKTLEEIYKALDDEKTKKLSNEIEQLKEFNEVLKQDIKQKQKLLEEENNETMRWHNFSWNESNEVERLKKLLSKMRGLNPGAEVPQCEDSKEYERAEKLYEMTQLLKDLFIRVAGKSLTREALNKAKEDFKDLKEMYDPCTCKNEACAKLRKEREAYIAEVEKALKNAERFLPSDLWEGRTSEIFLPSKPKAFSPSKPKRTESVSIQTDINRQFFEETETQHQALLKQIADLEKKKEEIETLEQISDIQRQEGDKTEEANQKLLEQIKGLEEQNERLRRENKDLEERLVLKEGELDFYTKDFLGTVGKEFEDENAALKKNIEEKDAIIAQKDADLEKQKNDLWQKNEENTRPKLQNLINEPEEGQTDNKENDEKKEDEGKKFKKPTNLEMAKEVDDFRNRLKRAGDNLRELESLRNELKNKPHLEKWVSDELKKAIKDAKERKDREEKYKKEEEEAKKEMNDLMLQLKNTDDVEQLKKGIATLLDYAQNRLSRVADKFGLEAAGSFVKDIGSVYGNDAEQIARKNVAGSFVHTVSLVQKNIMDVWKRMTVILKPKALPMADLLKATADEEEEKINLEAERRKRAVVQEKDAEIAELKKQLKDTEKKHKVEVLELKNRLQFALSSRSHMRGKTEMNLSSKTNGSSLYNLTEISDVRDEKDRDNGRYSTPCETQGKNKLRNGSARNRDNYSRDNSRGRSLMHSKTLLNGLENSDSRFEKYKESQIKSDNIWKNSDVKQRMSFTEQKNDANILGGILETKDDTSENILDSEWSDLQKEGRQLMINLTAYLSKKEKITELTWDKALMDQVIAWKKQAEEIFLNIGKNNRMPVAEPKLDKKTIKLPSTPKVIKKTKTEPRLLKTEKKSGALKRNLDTDFVNEQSGVKTKDRQPVYKKIDNRKLTNKKTKRK